MEKNFTWLFNGTNNICNELNSGDEDNFQFSCFERDPVFALLTLLFIYLPNVFIVRSIYGRDSAAAILRLWGTLSVIFGIILMATSGSDAGFMLGIFFLVLGASTFTKFTPSHARCSTVKVMTIDFCLKFLTYPLIILISPCLVVLIKLRTILPHNINLSKQKSTMSAGESLFEATPQLALQIYIVLTRSDRFPSYLQWAAMVGSLLTLALPSIETFLDEKQKNGFNNIAKYFPVFFCNISFRVLSLSIVVTYFKFGALLIWLGLYMPLSALCVTIIYHHHHWTLKWIFTEETEYRAMVFGFSFATATNLSDTKDSVFWRKVSAYWVFCFYCVILLFIMTNANLHWITAFDLPKLLELNENVPHLNILVPAVLGLGLGSLLLDTTVYKHCRLSPVFSEAGRRD